MCEEKREKERIEKEKKKEKNSFIIDDQIPIILYESVDIISPLFFSPLFLTLTVKGV